MTWVSASWWNGQVPHDWHLVPLKHLFRIQNGSTPKSDEPAFWDGDIPWMTPDDFGNLTGYSISRTGRHITKEGVASCATTIVPPGTIIVSTRAPIGYAAVSGVPLCTNQGCKSLVARSNLDSRYFLYQLLAAKAELESLGQGSTFRELSSSKLGSIKMATPSVEVQGAIGIFLDRETEKIDALVAKKERLIELLQEKRAALVAQVILKGADTNAEMKDSGIEWLGQIPSHWRTKKAKTIFREFDSRSVTGEEELLTVSHITGVTRRSEKNVNMFEAETTEGYRLCRAGDLVINTLWAWMGALGVARETGIVSPAYNVYRQRDKFYLPKYLELLSRIAPLLTELKRYSKGVWSSRLRLYPEEFFQIHLPVPPIEEQERILMAVENTLQNGDALVGIVQEGIDRLKEYRSALISAAVTGKIDVRNEVAEAT